MKRYTDKDRNEWGDVDTVKDGWSTCSLIESRGAPKRETTVTGWGGSRKYRKPIKVAVVPTDWLAAKRAKAGSVPPEAKAKARAYAAKRRAKTIEARERQADRLGVLPDSKTFAAYRRGEIDEGEARRIGEITARRHEHTNYDELLAGGCDKETARALMQPI